MTPSSNLPLFATIVANDEASLLELASKRPSCRLHHLKARRKRCLCIQFVCCWTTAQSVCASPNLLALVIVFVRFYSHFNHDFLWFAKTLVLSLSELERVKTSAKSIINGNCKY